MAQRGNDDDGNDMEEEEVVAHTPAVPSSVVRRPGLAAGGGAGGDDDDDDDADDWMRGGPSPLSRNRSSRDNADEDDDYTAREDDPNNSNAADDNGPNGDDDDDGEEEEANTDGAEDPATLIRGTDVHVQSAAAAFRDFIRTFVSVEESERVVAKERRQKSRRARARRAAAAGGAGGDDDDDNGWDVPSESDDEDSNSGEDGGNKAPLYLRKLEQILLRGQSETTPDSLTSSAANAGTGRVGVASLDLDALHLYYHSLECQRLYAWLVDYPSEIVPLMDILLGRELETLRDNLRLRQEEILAEAEANGDDMGMDAAAGILELLPTDILPRVQVRPFHLRSLSHMRSLDPNAIDALLGLRGMVVRTSPVIPDLKVAFFQCSICGHTDQVTIDRGRIAEPTQCPTCHVKHGFALIHNRCYYSDKQMVRVQETPDEVPAGETPASIVVFAYDDLVDAVRPGDRVEVTGVFRAQARRVNPKITKVKSVYKTYVDAIHFRKVVTNSSKERDEAAAAVAAQSKKKKRSGDDNDEEGDSEVEKQQQSGRGMRGDDVTHGSQFPPERIAELESLSKQPDVYDRLVRALAPSIWEMDDVKKGVLCMLFGGNSRKVKKGTAQRKKNRQRALQARRERIDSGDMDDDDDEPELEDDDGGDGEVKLNKRGDINILLVGDPGTSKSQLLGYVHKLSPRGVYTSGKGSSAVGLTASVVRDPETRELVMESGALVLSDLGICCIDEFVSL
jgi:DNA replication licensing factor MCM4